MHLEYGMALQEFNFFIHAKIFFLGRELERISSKKHSVHYSRQENENICADDHTTVNLMCILRSDLVCYPLANTFILFLWVAEKKYKEKMLSTL